MPSQHATFILGSFNADSRYEGIGTATLVLEWILKCQFTSTALRRSGRYVDSTHRSRFAVVGIDRTPLQDWTWTEKYPGWQELRQYFEYVESKLNVKKDTAFDSRVVSAEFDRDIQKWVVKTEDGRTARCNFLINAIGFAAKRYFPDWKGLENFKGEMHHSSFWPESGVDVKGKRVAVIGTGSTGIQIAQETAKEASNVTVFQRTPNLCLRE